MSFVPIEEDRVWFRSKGKRYSLIKERRGATSHSRIHALQNGRWRRRFIRFSSGAGWGWGQSSCASRAGVLLTALIPDRSARGGVPAHGPLLPSWIEVSCAALLHTPARLCLVQPFCTWNAGWKLVSACGTLWANETRRSTKEKKKVRLYYPDSIFISWEFLVGFAGDKSPLCRLSCSSFLRAADRHRLVFWNCFLLVWASL